MAENHNIRPMQLSDLEHVFKVRTATVENAITMEKLQSYDITTESMGQALQKNVKGWVCEFNQQIVGFSMGNNATAEMQVLAVLPDFEGHGIAKKLMHAVESWLFSQGHESLWLLTTPNPNFRAYGFYQHIGWEATGVIIDGEEKFTLSKSQSAQNF